MLNKSANHDVSRWRNAEYSQACSGEHCICKNFGKKDINQRRARTKHLRKHFSSSHILKIILSIDVQSVFYSKDWLYSDIYQVNS